MLTGQPCTQRGFLHLMQRAASATAISSVIRDPATVYLWHAQFASS